MNRKIKRHPDSLRETPPFYGQGGCHYPVPLHGQKAFRFLNKTDAPISEKIANEVLSLPIHPDLSLKDLELIAGVFK